MSHPESSVLADLREENLRLRMMIAALESSRSWKMTAPLRKYAAFLRAHHVLPEISQRFLNGQLVTYKWQEDTDLGTTAVPRIAVVAHVYYPELVDEIASAIQKCGPLTYAIVTYVDPSALPQIKSAFADNRISNVEYLLVENLGRDMWPFIQALKSESLNDVEAILKIHTKKSLHLEGGRGDEWRRSLINGLAPSQVAVENLAIEFAQNPQVAWACPSEWVAGNESWGQNKRTVKNLLGQLGLRSPRTLVFPAGSMFWMSRQLRTCLLDLELTRDNFSETPALDGSFEHGLERFIGSWALATQRIMYRIRHQPTTRTSYEYAEHLPSNQLDHRAS